MSLKFSRASRLTTSVEFGAVKKGGVKVRAGVFLISFLAADRQRLGIVVSRTTGAAVDRNRIKRVLREFFRTNRDIFPKGDIVIVAGRNAGEMSNGEIRESIKRALERIHVK